MFRAPVQRLHFSPVNDGDLGDESFGYHSLDGSMLNSPDEKRNMMMGGSPICWNSGLETPKSSPKRGSRRSSRRSDSPLEDYSLQESPYSSRSNSTNSDSNNGTPPHRILKNLRLFDSPQTPKSLMQQQELKSSERRNRNIAGRLFSGAPKSRERKATTAPRTRRRAAANVNPFNPLAVNGATVSLKRPRPERKNSITDEMEPMEDDFDEFENPTKRAALLESNISRYEVEFLEVCKIGSGEFGSVYRCINRLDGCTYAVKKSKKPIAGSILEKMALNEVYAHAVLGAHVHVVRYFSAWAEDSHMIIQNEYCNGGSLADVITKNKSLGTTFSEPQLKQILLQVSQGLEFIHNQGLVHLDIKPGNIFISHQSRARPELEGVPEEGSLEEGVTPNEADSSPVYKIGDLGHVTSVADPRVEEGDIRYLPNEILQENYKNLPKADVFSMALSVYESAGGGPLPKNGDGWHRIREGALPTLRHLSHDLNSLLKDMVNPEPSERPSIHTLVQHSLLCDRPNVVFTELKKELNAARFQNAVLSRELNEARKADTKETKFQVPGKGSSRMVGKKVNRSMSLTIY